MQRRVASRVSVRESVIMILFLLLSSNVLGGWLGLEKALKRFFLSQRVAFALFSKVNTRRVVDWSGLAYVIRNMLRRRAVSQIVSSRCYFSHRAAPSRAVK